MVLAKAIDYLLGEVFRIDVRKALDPNDPADFVVIANQLAQATKGLAQAEEAKALKKALALLDVDWKSMNADAKAKVLGAAKVAVNPVKTVLPKIEKHYEANAIALGQQVKGFAVKQFGFKVAVDLDKAEVSTLQHIAFSQGNYVRDEYGARSEMFTLKAKELMTKLHEKGLGRKDIAEALSKEMGAQQFKRSDAYWTVVAGAFVNRARTFTNLSTYESAGVEFFEFDAVVDERTSDVCRFMHGKRFPVAAAKKAFTQSETGAKPEDVKIAQPWVQVGRDKDGQQILYYKDGAEQRRTVAQISQSGMGKKGDQGTFENGMKDSALQRAGIMTPPLHGNCRSTINPVLEEGGVVTSAPGNVQTGIPEELAAPPPPPEPAPPAPKGPDLDWDKYADINDLPEDATPVLATALEPTAPPVEIYVPPPPKPMSPLDKLAAYTDPETGKVHVAFKGAASQQAKFKDPLIVDLIANGKFEPGMKKLESLQLLDPKGLDAIDPEKVAHYLKYPKLLQQATIKVVETSVYDGAKKFIIVGDPEAAMAQMLLGKSKAKIHIGSVHQHKSFKLAQSQAAAQASAATLNPPPKPAPAVLPTPAPPPPAPAAPAPVGPAINLPPPPPVAPGTPLSPFDPANILHHKYGAAAGSNEGGFYLGADGVKRYVKFYDDHGQSQGEMLANRLYGELGFASPNAHAWKDPTTGKAMYAADLLDGKNLSGAVSKEDAKKFFKGFAADVLLGNWDAAGMTGDNAFKLDDGRIARIDNGGALLMRAKAGRKDPAVLNAIPEWDRFFQSSNPGYYKMAKAAGYSSPADFKADVVKQIADIGKLEAKWGGWRDFVTHNAPSLRGADKEAIVTMLEERSKLLKQKALALTSTPLPKRSGPPAAGWRAPPLSGPGVAPRPGLKIADLPEAEPPKVSASRFAKSPSQPQDQMPWGTENRIEYMNRATKAANEMLAAHPAGYKGIQSFSASGYTAIRDSEEKGTPNAASKAMKRSSATVTTEPCTVYRGLNNLPEALVEQWLAHDGVFRLGRGNTASTSSSAWHPKTSIDGFMGGESDPSPHYGVKVLFRIEQKSGVPIETMSKSGVDETEILLPAGAEFRVVRSHRWAGKKRIVIIELEEI